MRSMRRYNGVALPRHDLCDFASEAEVEVNRFGSRRGLAAKSHAWAQGTPPASRQPLQPPLPMRRTVVTLVHAAQTLVLACAAATLVPDVAPAAESTLRVGVTTSFVSSGAAATLTPAFEQQTGIHVKLVVVGSGAALRMARVGEVDATVTHSPDDEQAFINDGLAAVVRKVMSNDFLIVGPAHDPAAARGNNASAALARIAAAGQPFVSRGDDSGTHWLELLLWKQAGIDPLGQSWYEETGRGMNEALQHASRRGAYLLVDRGTWLADRASLRLKTVVEGDPRTVNHYVAIAARAAGRAPTPAAQAWVEWLGSGRARQLISGLQIDGEPVFALPPPSAR
jgi:tungstate transport system substrate-binding protein